MLKFCLAAILAVVCVAMPAIAQTVIASDSVVSVPWGDILAGILPALQTLIFGGLLWIAATVAPSFYALLRTAQVEQLMSKALDFGFNAVAGAVKGKTLTVDIGNEVLKEIVAYALVHGGEWVKDFAGTTEQLAEKAFARVPWPADQAKPDFAEIARGANAKAEALI